MISFFLLPPPPLTPNWAYGCLSSFLLPLTETKSLSYNCLAPELVSGRFRARRFMHKYNSHFPDSATPDSLAADREVMLKDIFGKVGKDAFIEPPLNIDYGCNVSLGDGFYSNFKCVNYTLSLSLSLPVSVSVLCVLLARSVHLLLVLCSWRDYMLISLHCKKTAW